MITTHANFRFTQCEHINGRWVYCGGEYNNKPSLTIPDQVLPIAETLRRYVRGQDVQVFNPVYDEDLAPGYEAMNEMDRLDTARNMKDELVRTTRSFRPEPSTDEFPTPPDQPAASNEE